VHISPHRHSLIPIPFQAELVSAREVCHYSPISTSTLSSSPLLSPSFFVVKSTHSCGHKLRKSFSDSLIRISQARWRTATSPVSICRCCQHGFLNAWPSSLVTLGINRSNRFTQPIITGMSLDFVTLQNQTSLLPPQLHLDHRVWVATHLATQPALNLDLPSAITGEVVSVNLAASCPFLELITSLYGCGWLPECRLMLSDLNGSFTR
jgi:hypothetical protein